uniref:uncharacterized protein LOC131126050 isoform X1 n=1 Tax=Doryrhamphus excisus TaxID=161450 RepID=UPI0025ADFC4A|nr:uncharacterized protein LOC131126050 isoform X1 [Doryrhamphus excisus]
MEQVTLTKGNMHHDGSCVMPPAMLSMDTSVLSGQQDVGGEKTLRSGSEMEHVLREELIAHRVALTNAQREVDEVRSFWTEEFGAFKKVQDAAVEETLRATNEEWRRLWAEREDEVSADLLSLRESMQRHVEEHWDNMEWHLHHTLCFFDRQLSDMKQELQEKEEQATKLKEVVGCLKSRLKKKTAETSKLTEVVGCLLPRLQDKKEQESKLKEMVSLLSAEMEEMSLALGQHQQESQDCHRKLKEMQEQLKAERAAKKEVLGRQARLHKQLGHLKNLLNVFVVQNQTFLKSLRSNEASDGAEKKGQEEQNDGRRRNDRDVGVQGKKEKKERAAKEKKEKKELKEQEKKAKKEKKEREEKEKREKKEREKKKKKERKEKKDLYSPEQT